MTDKIEKLARIIAEAHSGWPADTIVCVGEPLRVPGFVGFVAPPKDYGRSLWMTYVWAAEVALKAGFDRPDDLIPAADSDESQDVEETIHRTWFGVDELAPAVPSQANEWRERMGLA